MKPVKTQITDLAAVCHETPNEKIAEQIENAGSKAWATEARSSTRNTGTGQDKQQSDSCATHVLLIAYQTAQACGK